MEKNQNINCILAIELENIYSIKDPVRIDFRAANLHTSQAKLLADNTFEWNGQKILKTIGLFGSNAAGRCIAPWLLSFKACGVASFSSRKSLLASRHAAQTIF